MRYQQLPYDVRFDERQVQFDKFSAERWTAYQSLRNGPPETIASRHNAHEAKCDLLAKELRQHIDATLPLLEPVFCARVLEPFLCPIVAQIAPVSISEDGIRYPQWEKSCLDLQEAIGKAQDRQWVQSYILDNGPRFRSGAGTVIAGFINESQCKSTTDFIRSSCGDALGSIQQVRVTQRVVANIVESDGTYRAHDSYGKVSLRIEPNSQGSSLFLNYQEFGHDLPEEYARDIFEGVQYAASLGLGLGNPIVGARVVVTAGRRHELDSRPSHYAHAAARAFADAIPRMQLREVCD